MMDKICNAKNVIILATHVLTLNLVMHAMTLIFSVLLIPSVPIVYVRMATFKMPKFSFVKHAHINAQLATTNKHALVAV